MKKLFTLFVIALGLGSAVKAQSFNDAKADSLLDVLDENHKAMGSVVVSQNGDIIYQRVIGYSSVNGQTRIPASAKTRYHVGSITKMFTGAIIFQLIDEGKLALETTLDKFYPQIPNAAKITIADLLNHHSGLHNFTNDPAIATYMTKAQTHEEVLARFAKMKPDFEPGTKGSYSNTGFVLLGYIIEKLTGKPYADNLKERVTSKLGLRDTYFGAKIDPQNNEALSYQFMGDWRPVPETDATVAAAAGSIVSTPADLAKFIEALFAGKLISADALKHMKTMKDDFGMAMFSKDIDGKSAWWHNGAIDAFRSQLTYIPEEKLAVSITLNGGVYSPAMIEKGLLNIYFNKPYTIPSFTPLALKTEDLDKYLGTYSAPNFPMKIAVYKDNTTLYGQATGQGPIKLETTVKDVFTFEPAGIVMEFAPNKKQFTLKQGGRVTVFTKE